MDSENTTVGDDSKKTSNFTSKSLAHAVRPKFAEEKGSDEGSSWSAEPFSRPLWQKGDRALARAWAAYLKALLPALLLITFVIFGVFAVFWGALWRVPEHSLPGWIVDFDGGEVGQAVIEGLTSSDMTLISWTTIPSGQFTEGTASVVKAIKDEKAWIIVAINEGATARLQDSLSNPNASYDGTTAITAFGAEARNENAYRNYLIEAVSCICQCLSVDLLIVAVILELQSTFLTIRLTADLVNPISYKLINVLPFSQPVATAATFVGLIYLLIMSFFVVVHIFKCCTDFVWSCRSAQLRSLIALRLLSSFTACFILSLWYSLLNLAFKLDVHHTGFVIFWMATWIYMLAVGLAVESLIVVLKQYIPFFLITWIIVNASVNVYPLEVLPRIFHYGFGAPFYNYSKAVRTIVFGTKNRLGLNLGILIVWIAVSCTTLAIIQWNARRLEIQAKKDRRNRRDAPHKIGRRMTS
ncbi:hypothetical protein BJ912DRAFT_853007 [Pholiota molesta]|nr:hypothetical protein BJ912DRAFT_853007 [Pholiota molesta]